MNRAPIFAAVKKLRNGQKFTLPEVHVLDAAIDEAFAGVSSVLVPATAFVPSVVTPKPLLSLWQAMIDLPFLKMAFPANTVKELAGWVEPVKATCAHWGIDTPREICSFLANINVESAGLTRLTENLNYSADALIAKFGRHRISIADAKKYGRTAAHPANQEMIANILYGGEFGRKNLGNTEFGDGWKYRGYGPKQVTGKANQGDFAKAAGVSLDKVPEYLRTKLGGMMSAGWFWQSHGLDAKAATPGLEDDRKAINGGSFGLAEVEVIFDKLLEEMLRREKELAK